MGFQPMTPLQQALAVALGVGWFVGIGVLRWAAITRAMRAGRGDSFDLWVSTAWMWERGKPWTWLGRLTAAWTLFPFALVAVALIATLLARPS